MHLLTWRPALLVHVEGADRGDILFAQARRGVKEQVLARGHLAGFDFVAEFVEAVVGGVGVEAAPFGEVELVAAEANIAADEPGAGRDLARRASLGEGAESVGPRPASKCYAAGAAAWRYLT